jgi:hypothetical protein
MFASAQKPAFRSGARKSARPREADVGPSVSSITPRCYAATTRGPAAIFSDG